MGQVVSSNRNAAVLNGAAIAIGLIGVIDNVIAHWLLRLHRIVPGPEADVIEPVVVAASAALLSIGIRRELVARGRGNTRQRP